jgi:hypothetical protein
MTMEPITLTRTGQPPLDFTGELVAESNGRVVANREQNRWHDLRLYRTAGGQYVLDITYRTEWVGEVSHHWAEIVEPDTDYLTTLLAGIDPCEHLQGFPDHPDFAHRQAKLEAWLRRRFEAQVSELIAQVPDLHEHID